MRTRRVGRPRTGRGCGAGNSTGQGAGSPGSILRWQWLRLLSGHRCLLGIMWSVAPGFLGCFQQGVGQAPTLSFFSAVEQGTYIFIVHWATFPPSLEGLFCSPCLLWRSPGGEESRRAGLLLRGCVKGGAWPSLRRQPEPWLLAHAGPPPYPWQSAAAHSAYKWPHPLEGPAGWFHNCVHSMEPVLGKLGTGQLSPWYGKGLGP